MAIDIRTFMKANLDQANEASWALKESGYVPSNRSDGFLGLIDSFQGNMAGSFSGLMGSAAAWSAENGYDWLENNATWAGRELQTIAKANEYRGGEGGFFDVANGVAGTLGSSAPALIAGLAARAGTAAAGAAVGSAFGGVGAIPGAIAGFAVGTAADAGTNDLINSGQMYFDSLDKGLSKEQALANYNQALTDNIPSSLLGAVGDQVSMGFVKAGGKVLGAFANGGGKVAASQAAKAGVNVAIGSALEGYQEAWEDKIANNILEPGSMDNVSMMAPTTWTDEMWDDAKMAALSSGILGGAAHGIRAMVNQGNNSATPTIEESIQPEVEATTPTVPDAVETPSMEGITISDPSIGIDTDTMDVNLGSIEPEVLAPKEMNDFAPVLDAMNSRFEKNGYAPEDITAKNEAVAMTAQQISDLWDNSDSAKDITKVKRDAFVADFENAGLTKPEATEASRKLHKLLLDKQANVDTKPAFEGSYLVEKADSLGVNLTEAERNDLLGENPTPSNVREIDERLTKAAYEDNQNRYKRQLQAQELANRADYSNRYRNNESFGSNYFNARFPENRAEETSYRFSKAMAERKKDMAAGKPNSKTNQLIPYLNRNGITTKEYSKQEISDINAYAKTIDKAKQQVDNGAEISGGLQRVARDTASIQNMDRQTTKILSQFDEASKPEETTEKATMLAKALANVQKKTGLDISKTKAYKAIRALKDKTAYNIIKPQKVKTAQPINNQTVQPTVSDKIKDVQAQAKPASAKPNETVAPNVDEDEITGYEDFNSAIPKVESVEDLKRSLSASDSALEVSPKENTTQVNEEQKNEPVKEEKKERSYSIKDKHNIVYDFVDGHITATEAKKHLTTLMKSNRTSKKEIQYLKKLESYIDRNIDKENDMYKSRSGVGLDKMETKINEMIAKLKGDIDTGKVTQKKYEDSVKNIERAIDTFYSTYPKTLDTHYFEIPEKHKMNQGALAEAALNGEVEIPSYVKNAIIKTPSKIDELTLRWMNKELDRNDTSFRLGVRNKIIYRVLSNEYTKVMEVGPDNMMVTHPRDVQGLAYAIAGSFPDNSMPGKGAEAQKSRHKAMFPNNPQALRSVGNSDKAGMIAFARKYFAGKFNPEKTEVVEKFNPQKEEKKRETSPFTISSVKVSKTGSDEVHVTIKYTPSKELTDQFVKDNIDSLVGQKLEDAFLDAEPENMTITSIRNGTIEITTIPSLSYKEFGDKYSSGDNKGNMYDKDVRDARDISLEIAVNAANGEAVAFGNDNLNYKEVQTKLDKVFGKGKYNVVSDSDGNNYIKPADKQLTDDMKDNAMFFQYGKDEKGKSTEKADKEEVSVAKSIIEKNHGELKLPNMFAKNIANSIKYFMGDYAGTVFNYLKKAKHLRIRRVSDSNKNYNGLSLLNHGIIEMNEKVLTDTSSMPLHELVHDAVYSITNGGEVKNGEELHAWLSDVIDQAKEEIEHGISTEVRLAGGTGSAVYGRDGNAVQRLRMSGGGTGGIHVPNDGHVVSSDGAGQSHESNRGSNGSVQRNVGEQSRLQTDGKLAETSQLDGRNEKYSGDSGLERGAGATQRGILQRVRRRWNNAKNLVEKTTNENVGRQLKDIQKEFNKLLNNHEMYHTEKAHAILSYLWAAREIDKKLGFKKNSKDRLYTRLTENPPTPESNKKFSTIFQEAIAYASHTIAKPAKVAELFNLAQQSQNLSPRSDYNSKAVDTNEDLLQIGKEDPVRDVKAVATDMLEGAKEALKMKRDSNINIKTRDMKQGNIPSAWVKKFLASPTKLIKKYISDAAPMIRWAEQAEVEKDKLRRKYIKRWESIHNKLSDTDKNKFFQVLKDMTDLGREYMQTMRVDYKGRDIFINISDKDTFFESPELDEAQKTYNELKNSGKNAYMDFKDGMFRVFGSDNEIKPYSSFETASKIAKAQTDAIMKAKGYSNAVVKAYGDYRNLMTSIYKDSMDAWHKTGEDPDTKPRYLYAYTPMLHSRYGVYVVTEHEHNGKVYNQYDKVASFHNIPDAKRWARELKVKGNQRIDVIQHGTRFDDTTSAADLYDGYSYDEKYDDVIEQYETNESREARFNRLSNSYTELKKFLENDITNRKRLSAEELIKMLNDTEKLKELNVDRKALAKEIGDANLKELFKQKQAINKDDLIKHLLIGYGNHLKDKYNNKRTGAKGANPDMYDNIVNYMYYKAKQIPNQKFYHKATSLYRDITGNDYKTQFGRNGRGAENDSQEVLNRFISSVVGVPNGFDTKLNESFNETSIGKFAKEHYGDTFITDLMNRGMEATTIAKLGLFRPTAAIAQLGTLLNVYAKAGWNSNFRNALKDATMVKGSNVSMTEKKMFNEIGLDLENTSMETQTLSNRKSLYNLKVGKVRVGKLLEKSMATFNAADKYTRRVAALTAFRKAIKEGKSYDEAVMEASDFVRNTNFDYADKDASKLFTSAGTLGKMILQFKKYPVKEMEFMMDLFSKDERTESERRREITRFLASYTVAAGIMGLPMLAVGDELAELLFGKTITGTAKDAMFSWAGKDPVKNNIAQFLAYGALAPTMGVDFSRNIGLGDIVPTSDFAGPTLTTIGKMISSIREQKSMDDVVLAVAHDLSPAMGNYYQFMTGKQRDWKNGIDGREYSTGERFAKLAGFRTVKESVDSDMAYALYQKQTDEKNKKKALIYEYLENPSSVSKEEMRKYGIKGTDIKKAKEQIVKSKLERQEQYLPKKKRTDVTDTADKYNEFYEGL